MLIKTKHEINSLTSKICDGKMLKRYLPDLLTNGFSSFCKIRLSDDKGLSIEDLEYAKKFG